MVELKTEMFRNYLSQIFKKKVEKVSIQRLGVKDSSKLKRFGYGKPYLIQFQTDGVSKEVILGTMRGDSFGHEFPYDRAQNLLMAYQTFNKIPRHVKALDIGVITKTGHSQSIREFKEFYLMTDKIKGDEYFKDLETIKKRRALSSLDKKRCIVLSDYLVKIHARKNDKPNLYKRRIRELIGHSECIMGLIDNYPTNFELFNNKKRRILEHKCIEWRWKIIGKTTRLSQVHGDYHPWNIMFTKGTYFTVLDRSRGEWGEPADDVAAMTINYLLYSLNTYGNLSGSFESLFRDFFFNYLKKTKDSELLNVIQPFYAWRGLVLANPLWYPGLHKSIREKLFNFIFNVLSSRTFNFKYVNSYLEEKPRYSFLSIVD